MLRAVRLPYKDGRFCWSISPYTGSLLRSKISEGINEVEIPKLVHEALSFCDKPFTCGWGDQLPAPNLNLAISKKLRRYNKILSWLGNDNFLLSTLYSGVSTPLFSTTCEAYAYFQYLSEHSGSNSIDKCFQRSLLAAKTSASFKKEGVLFIGAMLGSFDMHAWIIEAGVQPDLSDRHWINFRPLLAYVS